MLEKTEAMSIMPRWLGARLCPSCPHDLVLVLILALVWSEPTNSK